MGNATQVSLTFEVHLLVGDQVAFLSSQGPALASMRATMQGNLGLILTGISLFVAESRRFVLLRVEEFLCMRLKKIAIGEKDLVLD